MEELLGRRKREETWKDDMPKRLKRTDGSPSALLLALPDDYPVLSDKEISHLEDIINQGHSKREKSLSKLMSSHAENPPLCTHAFLLASMKETAQAVPINALAKNTGDKYANETEYEKQLTRARSEVEGRHKAVEDKVAKVKAETQLRVATRGREIAAMTKMKGSEEEKLKKEIDRTQRDLAIYKRMSGVEVQENGPGTFRCCAQVHCNELIFLLRPLTDRTTDYETVSFTVPGERVPNVLKEIINVDEKDVPELLLRVLNTLI